MRCEVSSLRADAARKAHLKRMIELPLLVHGHGLLQPHEHLASLPILPRDPAAHATTPIVVLKDRPRHLGNILLTRRDGHRLALRKVGLLLQCCRSGRGGARERVTKLDIEDRDDRVVLLGDVVEQHSFGESLLLIGAMSCRLDDATEVGPLVFEVNEFEVSLDLARLRLSDGSALSDWAGCRGHGSQFLCHRS